MYKKMAIVGEVGSGKTQLVETLSEIQTFSTDVESSIDIGKQFTTVGIDYGRISLTEDTVLGLYGVPGQMRYEFLWKMICEELWGVVILIKHTQEVDVEHIGDIISFFSKNNKDVPFVVGLTHCEYADKEAVDTSISAIDALLCDNELQAPIIPFDPRDQVSALLPLTVFTALVRQNNNNNSGDAAIL